MSKEDRMSSMAIDRNATMTEAVDTMKAIVAERYGRPDVLALRDVERPAIQDDQVLVRVHASSVNPVEWYRVTGPLFARGGGLRRPATPAVGADLAGRVEAVGSGVTSFAPGDEVFGTGSGAWAEYAAAGESRLAPKPAGVSFEEAAAVPIAAITALQALRDHGHVEPGQTVVVNGASGGVGTYAVQLAKLLGADVTAVCSTQNVEQARSLGADRVVDYTREDFTRGGVRHDLLIDVAGSRSLGALRRALTPDATIVLVGGRMTYRGLGPLPHLGATLASAKLRRQTLRFFVANVNSEDLEFLASLLADGSIRSVIERTYALDEAPAALAHLGEGHARGKLVITM
jgi:NADPH:quinone reductase-like Zn-dependent oxidoreductase